MPAKKPKQLPKQLDEFDTTTVLGSGINLSKGVSYSGPGSTVGYDPLSSSSSYTISIDPSNYSTGSITSASTMGYNWNSISSSQYTTVTGSSSYNSVVNIDTNGITMQEGADITIKGRKLSEVIDKLEERLGILHPNPELEDRWDELKELRRKYNELEKDLLEKEKMWKILKEK
jgi:hypothetical protein